MSGDSGIGPGVGTSIKGLLIAENCRWGNLTSVSFQKIDFELNQQSQWGELDNLTSICTRIPVQHQPLIFFPFQNFVLANLDWVLGGGRVASIAFFAVQHCKGFAPVLATFRYASLAAGIALSNNARRNSLGSNSAVSDLWLLRHSIPPATPATPATFNPGPLHRLASPCSRFKRRGNKTGNATSAKLHKQRQGAESGVARTSLAPGAGGFGWGTVVTVVGCKLVVGSFAGNSTRGASWLSAYKKV